jgi:hypothetical protein
VASTRSARRPRPWPEQSFPLASFGRTASSQGFFMGRFQVWSLPPLILAAKSFEQNQVHNVLFTGAERELHPEL